MGVQFPLVLSGGAGPDTLYGGSNDDELYGDEGSDQFLAGGGGDDLLDGGPGADNLGGGDGSDAADYTDRTAPVIATFDGRRTPTTAKRAKETGSRPTSRVSVAAVEMTP